MSRNQIEGSIITIANGLFGRKDFGEWKIYDKHTTLDNNTLPSMTNITQTESYMEAMVLNFIVQEIMNNGKFKNCILLLTSLCFPLGEILSIV